MVRGVFLLCFVCSSVYAFLPPSFFLQCFPVYDGGLWVVSGRGEGRVSSRRWRNFLRLSALVMELEGEMAQNNSGINSTRSGKSREERQRGTRCILSGSTARHSMNERFCVGTILSISPNLAVASPHHSSQLSTCMWFVAASHHSCIAKKCRKRCDETIDTRLRIQITSFVQNLEGRAPIGDQEGELKMPCCDGGRVGGGHGGSVEVRAWPWRGLGL